ncbi:MAG: amino acid deaminase/aldolase [Saprospiraceae bacterium]|nr:amino acid deaminase/aldolase [Saprospiraceae bacterium]
MDRTYSYYKKAFKEQEKPFAYIDLEFFDYNVKDVLKRAKDKKVRIASKSIRSVSLMKRILDYSPQYQGIMCFTSPEAVWLSELGFDDLLVAYPTFQNEHIKAVAHEVIKGKKIYLMTDKPEHLQQINEIGKQLKVKIPICMDLDMSSNFPGLYFGVHRSSLNSFFKVKKFLKSLSLYPYVELKGVMGYEAQIAGVGNNVYGKKIKNSVINMLQKTSIIEIVARRKLVVNLVMEFVDSLDFVNGGGTGSIEMTRDESQITEIAVGSAFYNPTLFDNYNQFKHFPAAGYAIEIVRKPKPNVYTCLGGGYVASGSMGPDKLPMLYLPKGCKFFPNEMAGEVQTPIYYKGKESLNIGDPVFLRHSKAGELCERFNYLLLLQDGEIVDKVLTYRGDGKCFL